MRPSARILTLGLAFAPLVLSAACASAGSGAVGQIDCMLAQGVDAAPAQALCDALRAQAPDKVLRVQVLATGPTVLSARLDRVTAQGNLPGERMDYSVMDRDLRPDDFISFARDLLRFGLAD